MTTLSLPWSALHVAGQRWTVWVVGIGLTIAHRSGGADGLDAVMQAAGPTILWGCCSWGCRLLTSGAARRRRSIVPTNPQVPKPRLAVLVVPPCPPDACPDMGQMVDRLPEHLRRLVTPQAS